MKRIYIFLLFRTGIFSGNIDRETCTLNGKRLYGKVKAVSSTADFRVEVVNHIADVLHDFTVEFAGAIFDFKTELVNMFPGAQ